MRARPFALRIKRRPIPPRTPHLKGKVERAQKTARGEPYATTSVDSAPLADDVEDWLDDYHDSRVHGHLGVTPIQRRAEREEALPSWEEVVAAFDREKESPHVELLTPQRLRAARTKTSKSETMRTNLAPIAYH